MRVLVSYVTVGRGGDAVQVLALKAAFETLGHHVVLVGPHAVTPYAFGARATWRDRLRRVPWWLRDTAEVTASLVVARSALAAIAGGAFDLVLHRAGVYDLAAAALARRSAVPIVVYFDSHVEAERRACGDSHWRWLHAWTARRAGVAADVACVPSNAVATYYAGLGVPEDRLLLLPNGVSEAQLRLGHELAQRQPPFTRQNTCTIGYVGSLASWHRVDLLLDALRRLRTAGSGTVYRATIVGEGHTGEALRRLAGQMGLERAVTWRGALEHGAAIHAIGKFDVAVLPDTLDVGAPMKLSEYAAAARPIVAPDRANIRDLFAPGREVVLVPPGDAEALAHAVSTLAADPEGARRIGMAAQTRVAERTWEAAITRLLGRLELRIG